MGATADLAEYRLLRALKAGQPGAFPSLWNAQAGAVWSVVRALCATDREAVGWVVTFRVELAENLGGIDPGGPVGAQIGAALYRHLHGAFDRDAALPEGPLPADEEGLRRVPEHPRLLYLVDLFFDLGAGDLKALAGRDAPATLERVRKLFEPRDDTDARDAVHAALLRAAPAEALILPPGEEPEPPKFRFWPWIVGGAALLLVTGVLLWGRVGAADWDDLAGISEAAMASRPILGGSPPELGQALVREGVPAVLAEAPDLSAVGLTLLGAYVRERGQPVIVLLYHGREGTWTLQHHLAGPSPEGPVLAGGDGLDARDAGGLPAVAWTEAGTTWALLADAPPERVLDVAARIRETRRGAGVPFLGSGAGAE